MGFLGDLGNAISSQYNLGENTNHTLDSIDPTTGKNVPYGSLGDFANQIDQSAQRSYVEEGYLRTDPYTAIPKQFEVYFQEPNATVFIKKRMFSSVADNFRQDFMDADELLYLRSIKTLFQNKCTQISALEKLSKLQKISESVGSVSDQLMPLIMTTSDLLSQSIGSGLAFASAIGGTNSPLVNAAASLNDTINKIRRVYGFNTTATTTSWITDSTAPYPSQLGVGTGVIEITNMTSINTNVSTDISNPGNFSMSIVDPYECMLITEFDIEKAISDASNMYYNSSFYQLATQSAAQSINDKKQQLNQARIQRGVSTISFKVDPNTLLGKRVTAILDNLGIELPFTYDSTSAASILSGGALGNGATVPPEYLLGGAIAGNDGLASTNTGTVLGTNIATAVTQSEVSLFSDVVSAIFNKLSMDANSQNSLMSTNALTNYARRKMRFNFSGKLIIQPMDVIHIYMSSKNREDIKLLSGLQSMFSGGGILQNLNNTATAMASIASGVSTLFNPSGNIPFQIEKAAYVGSTFPNYLWSIVRSEFVTENEGTHVFAGIVDSAVDNWSNGKFVVNVSGRDNLAYLEQGKVNFKPGIDAFNGAIFDPLTPFKTEFDTISSNNKSNTPVLLDENEFLMGNVSANRSPLLKYKLGRYAGQLVTSDTLIQDRNIDPVTGRPVKIFYAPDGLVYKWKEGIGVFTQFGSNLLLNPNDLVGNTNIAQEPFAGQDVMNVISLCITGQPYNFSTYFKATQQLGNIGSDPLSGNNAAHSYIQSVRNDLSKNNTLWGNFIPFKSLIIDEASYALSIQQQASITQQNETFNSQLKTLANLNQQAIACGAINFLAQESKYAVPEFENIKSQISNLGTQIATTLQTIQNQNTAFIQNTGTNNTYESTNAISSGTAGDVRKQLNYLTRRMSYSVRANEDKNLFIVDDSYDKDLDIMAYEKSLNGGVQLYNNPFTSVKEKVQHVANLINLEVFADTQGHIRARSPQYNKMPSSVFNRMMYLKNKLNIQVFPTFLSDLFNTQLDSLRTNIEVLEDTIRLDCAILNHKATLNDDSDATAFIANNNPGGGSFAFISDPDSGNITEIQDLMSAANPNDPFANEQALIQYGTVTQQANSTKNVITNSQKYTIIIQQYTGQLLNNNGIPSASVSNFQSNPVIDQLVSRIQTKSGTTINKSDYLVQAPDGVSTDLVAPTAVAIDVFKVVNELSDKIIARQSAVKLFYNTLKNASEYQSLDQGTTGNSVLPTGTQNNSNIPPVFAHMIEDETNDDYGIGSGSRYIIKRAQIRNITISENPPPWTTVEVHGVINPFEEINKQGPPNLNSFPGGGNGLVTALAIDYSLWQNYGFKEAAVVDVPFLSDPINQLAPYASMLLSRNRKKVFSGSVTISGNEYQQVGEVVYLEDRCMLFYVTGVSHSFNYGSNFTTTLNLSYGHTAGEYIPAPTDIIGKFIFNNKDSANLVVQRQDTSANELSVGVIQFSTSSGQSLQTGTSATATPNSFSATNNQVIQNIMFNTAYQVLNNNLAGTGMTVGIELRIYANGAVANPTLSSFASSIKGILTGSGGFTTPPLNSQGVSPNPLPASSVTISTVNLSSTTDRRSPSQQALAAARNQANYIGSNTGGPSSGTGVGTVVQNDPIKNALTQYIVDCWLVASPTTTTTSTTTPSVSI